MTIMVNGEFHEVAAGHTVLQLLETLGVLPQATVVQRNDEIVDREHFADTVIEAGDRFELVRLVGGG